MKAILLRRVFVWVMLCAGSWLAPGWAAGRDATPRDLQLFLLLGQSNMSGRGVVEAVDKVPHERVFTLTRDLEWIPAVDPLHFDKPAVVGVGLASTFARVIAAHDPQARIGLVPAAVGGTSLEKWKPGGELYNNAVARTKFAMKTGTMAGILWHQGEGDTKSEFAETYAARFLVMITQLRADLGAPDLLVVVGGIGAFRANSEHINPVLARLPDSVPSCAFASSEGFNHIGDKTHFDSASLREFGRRYARAYLELRREP